MGGRVGREGEGTGGWAEVGEWEGDGGEGEGRGGKGEGDSRDGGGKQ